LKAKFVIPITIFCFVLGLTYYLFQQKRLVVFLNFQRTSQAGASKDLSEVSNKQEIIKLYVYKDDKIVQQDSSIPCGVSIADNLKHLVNAWINASYQSQILERKVVVKHVGLSSSGQDAYLSFDSSPLSASWSIYKKWQVLESLLKTIRESDIHLNMIFFREKHSPMEDEHLDFSQGWPIVGYAE